MTGISYPQNAASREESDPTQIDEDVWNGLAVAVRSTHRFYMQHQSGG